MGGGILAYGAIMCASVIGGLFEGILGFLLKPLRRFFPAVVTGTVVPVSYTHLDVYKRQRSLRYRHAPFRLCGENWMRS